MHWDSGQYLKFGEARTQASRDLARRVRQRLPQAARILDLGCGPGNSTAVLADLWPRAAITGLDASATMLDAARQNCPQVRFIHSELVAWLDTSTEAFDLVFSNSALQWVPDYAALLPRLLDRVAPGGALAFQVPANWNAAVCQLPRDIAASANWQAFFAGVSHDEWQARELTDFYDRLAPHAADLELWETEYVQVMDDAAAIVEWYKGSGLRPYLETLPDDDVRQRFLASYLEGLRAAYPPRASGRILFPFRRRFVIAWARG